MPLNNLGLKLTLHDIKLICRHKFFLAQTIHGFNHPQIESAILDVKTTFRAFDHSEIWLQPIHYDALRLMEVMIQLDRVPVFDLEAFIDAVDDLIMMLQNEILSPPEAAAAEPEPEPEIAADRSTEMEETSAESAEESAEIIISDFNLKVLNQLMLNQRNIRNKERVFKRKGEDLSQDTAYQATKKDCRAQIRVYRNCLKTNAVDSAATDIIIFEEIGRAVKNVLTVALFQQVVKKYSEVVHSKLPVEDDPAQPIADTDSDAPTIG